MYWDQVNEMYLLEFINTNTKAIDLDFYSELTNCKFSVNFETREFVKFFRCHGKIQSTLQS